MVPIKKQATRIDKNGYEITKVVKDLWQNEPW